MIITCPSCATRYEIPPASLGAAGRMVRCTNCSHRWFVSPEAEPEGSPAAAGDRMFEPEPVPESAVASPAPPPVAPPAPLDRAPEIDIDGERSDTRRPPQATRSTAATLGWLAVLLILLILTGLVLGRNELVAIAPQTAPLYQSLGLPVTRPMGLELAGIVSERLAGEDGDTLRITGAVRNVAGTERNVPRLRIALLDNARDEVLVREVDVPQAVLPAGGSTRFSVDLEDPPAEARNFSVTFAVGD